MASSRPPPCATLAATRNAKYALERRLLNSRLHEAGQRHSMRNFTNQLTGLTMAVVPEARQRIAQRFNAGLRVANGRQVPKGRQSTARSISAVPSGRDLFLRSDPALKRWAILGCPFGT